MNTHVLRRRCRCTGPAPETDLHALGGTFGLSFGLRLIAIAWVSSYLRIGVRARTVLLGLSGAAVIARGVYLTRTGHQLAGYVSTASLKPCPASACTPSWCSRYWHASWP